MLIIIRSCTFFLFAFFSFCSFPQYLPHFVVPHPALPLAFVLPPQSIVNIRNIQLLNNPARWEDEYNFRITFECVEPLKEDIEWKLLYVGDAKTEEYDQELDSCMGE